MGRKRAWFKYLFSPSNNDSESCFSIRGFTGCLNQANCLLHSLTPTARKWTLHASRFPRRDGNLNGPGGSTSPGWKRSGTALPFFSLEEVVNPGRSGCQLGRSSFLILLKATNVLILCRVSFRLSWLNVLKASHRRSFDIQLIAYFTGLSRKHLT